MKKAKKFICLLLCCTSMLTLTACSDEEKLLSVLLATEIFGEKTVNQAINLGVTANKIGKTIGEVFDTSVDFNYEDGYKDGVITKTGWENEFFNLKFTLPQGYEFLPIEADDSNTIAKTEMNAGHKGTDENGQRYGATVQIMVSQLPTNISDKDVKNMVKDSITQDGFTFVSESTTTISNENYYVFESIFKSESGDMTTKRFDRRKGNKLLSIVFLYNPVGYDAHLETAFNKLK